MRSSLSSFILPVRSRLLLLGLAMLGTFTSRAQLVALPDPQFTAFLRSWYPEIFVNDSLDTASPALAAIDTLQIVFNSINDFSGLEFFTGVVYLEVAADDQTHQPLLTAWPPNMEYLLLMGGGTPEPMGPLDLSVWAPLPSGTTKVQVVNLDLQGTLILPESVRTLWIGYMRPDVARWPEAPEGITEVGIYNCPNADLADYAFPSTLRTFATHNSSTTLPDLHGTEVDSISFAEPGDLSAGFPETLRHFYFETMAGPHCLPHLPEGMETITAYQVSANSLNEWDFFAPNIPAGLHTEVGPRTDGSGISHILPGTPWSCYCYGTNHIRGKVFSDEDGDGVADPGEPVIANNQIRREPDLVVGTSDGAGAYDLLAHIGDYTMMPVLRTYQTFVMAAPTAAFATTGLTDTGNDLGLVLEGLHADLEVSITSTEMRPGFATQQWISYRNAGTKPLSGTVEVTLPAGFDLLSSTPAADMNVDRTWSFTFTGLALGESRNIVVRDSVPADVPLGTARDITVVYSARTPENVQWDTTVVYTDTIVGSYDPNDKRVEPQLLSEEEMQLGKPVEYTIRFQNTGTFLAENVLITDDLPAGVDPASFTFLASSHSCRWQLQNGQVQFDFTGIMLPDSGADQLGSQGFVKFRTKPRTDLPPGAEVSNMAAIHFDFNPPVITEPAVFMVDNQVGIAEERVPAMRVWPNPVQDQLNVVLSEPSERATVELLDVSGRVVLRIAMKGARAAVDVPSLAPGTYLLRVQEAGRVRMMKVVKH